MSIISILQTILGTISPAPNFYYGSNAQQNIKADNEDTTNAALYLTWPVYSENAVLPSGAIQESYPLIIFFFQKTGFNNTPAQHQVIIDAMRQLANTFVIKCKQSKLFFPDFKYKIIDDVNAYDLNAAGSVLEIRLTPISNLLIC